MNDFRPQDFQEAVAQFRHSIHREGERTESPGLPAILSRERQAASLRLRWAAAALVALMLAAVPAYVSVQQRQRETEQEKADTLLLQQVNTGLSRSVPRAMTPLMGWAPAGNGEAKK
jgi:hypothetical protein